MFNGLLALWCAKMSAKDNDAGKFETIGFVFAAAASFAGVLCGLLTASYAPLCAGPAVFHLLLFKQVEAEHGWLTGLLC
jgi:hypothetical protein